MNTAPFMQKSSLLNLRIDENLSTDNDTQYSADLDKQNNFANFIRSQIRKYSKRELNASGDRPQQQPAAPHENERDFLFLQKDHSFVNLSRKTVATNLELELKRKELASQQEEKKPKFNIYNTKVYETQNPNIDHLLKDVRTKSSLSQLQEELKNEFDKFLSFTIENSVKKVATKDEDAQKENASQWNFLTQIDENAEVEKEWPRLNTAESINYNNNNNVKLAIENGKSVEKNENNLQLALVESKEEVEEESWKNSSLIKLNKIIGGIKRIDLPKFQPELHQLCQYGSDAEILKVYPENLTVYLNEKQNGLGRYCIHECCVKGNLNMLKSILPYIDDINKLDQNKQNAAHVAVKYGELECLKVLVANEIDLSVADKHGLLVTHLAAQVDHAEIVEFLYELGAPFKIGCDEGKLPLHYAAEYGSFKALKKICEIHVDVSVRDSDGNTPAHLAAKNDHLKCLKYLIKLGVPFDKVRNNLGRNVAHICCFHGAVKSLHWLLENGADRFGLDDCGNSLAHTCCLGGQAECFNCCIQHDVTIDSVNFFGETAINLARKVGKSCHIEKVCRIGDGGRPLFKKRKHIVLERYKWEKEHEKSLAEKSVDRIKEKIYDVNDLRLHHTKSKQILTKKPEQNSLDASAQNRRDLIAQYFGPDI